MPMCLVYSIPKLLFIARWTYSSSLVCNGHIHWIISYSYWHNTEAHYINQNDCHLASSCFCSNYSWPSWHFLSCVTVHQPSSSFAIVWRDNFLFILVIFILASIPFPNSCKCRPRHMMKSLLFMLETLFIAGLFIFASLTYYSIVKSGMNMDGVKGYTLSLIPTILISVSVWIIKIKYLKEVKKRGSLRKPKIKRENSLLTDEEMISLSTTG